MDTFLKPEVIWFLIGLVLILLEFPIPGIFILFFGLGSWLVSITCLFIDISLTIQLSLFLVSSILLLVLFRSHLQRLFGVNTVNDMDEQDEFIGAECVVTEKISAHSPGKIELNGTMWVARSTEEITVGSRVQITGRDSIKFTVEPIK